MKLSSLTDLLTGVKGGPEGFERLGEDLEYILGSLDQPGLHPNFKADIYELLTDTVALARLLAAQSYDARRATGFAGNIHAVVARIVQHLASRPTNTAFGILFPRTNVLHEDIYSSEEEALQKLSSLQRLGLRENGEVVAVQVTSTKLAPPKAGNQPLESNVAELTKKIEDASK
jgi:hypothetical protein